MHNCRNNDTIPLLSCVHKDNYEGCSSNRISKENDENSDRTRYPIAVFFVLCSKFFESFAANGIRTVLALFIYDRLKFSENLSKIILHVFNFFSQFFPIFGAILADSYFGNTRTIFYFIFPYAVGYIGLTVATLPSKNISINVLALLSLLLISIGNGNLRACIASLGGNQFVLPEQKNEFNQYFANYYFVYTLGILLSKLVPPSIREVSYCFGSDDCYTAVFGFITLMFLLSSTVFIIGMFFYRKEEVQKSNILFKVIGCISFASLNKIKGKSQHYKHWLESATEMYSKEFVVDVIILLKIIKLYIPLPVYWSLLAQQDSSWTFQATKMKTNVFGMNIQPDQVKALGPIFLLIQIPLWEKCVLPFFRSRGYHLSSLSSVSYGGICSALSFICSGILQYYIEKSDQPLTVMWQIPQFFLIMMGEVLLSIPGLHFSFTEAPESMKSVLTAAWFINNAIGNLIVIIITELRPVKSQTIEFFLYAVLMFLAVLIFKLLSLNYKYTRHTQNTEPEYVHRDNEENS